ncbi:MAG: glycosyltransferase family 39 protein [Pyrinomonadaceae bacterium]
MSTNLGKIEELKAVLFVTAAGFAFRIVHYFLFASYIVAGSDAMQNIKLGRKFASGNFSGVLDTYWPPLYPILIGAVTIFVDDLVLPAVIISIVAGSLAVPLTYYFVRQSYGHDAGIVAAVLAVFFPYLINSVFAIGTENLYYLFIVGALFTGWKGLMNDSPTSYLSTGVLLGLGYLTRPEAIGYPIFFIALAVGKAVWQKRPFRRETILQVSSILLGFALLSVPYLLYLKSETGSWTISGKMGKNFASGVFSEEQTKGAPTRSLEDSTDDSRPTIKNLASNFFFNLREAHKAIGELMPIFLLLLAGLGLFGEKLSEERLKREAFLVAFCFLTIVGYAATWVLERYLYILFPIFFGWIALGIIRLERWYRESVSDWTFGRYLSRINYHSFVALCLVLVYLYVFTTNFYVRSSASSWQQAAYEERDAGKWIKENGKSNPNLFTESYRPAFYADGIQYWSESTDLEVIMSQIKQCKGDSLITSGPPNRDCKIDYVVSSERSLRGNPFLENFTDVLRNDPEFTLVYETDKQPGYKISVFEHKQNSE